MPTSVSSCLKTRSPFGGSGYPPYTSFPTLWNSRFKVNILKINVVFFIILGGFVNGHGRAPTNRASKVFMVTNLCPNVSPNSQWCGQTNQHPKNSYGYLEHFDLENGNGQISALGWNNPEVTWEFTSCNNHERLTPNDGLFHQCQCAHQGK